MRAIVQDRYGSPDTLELRDIEAPEVGDDQVLVRVHASSVNAADWHIMRGWPLIARGIGRGVGFGLFKPTKHIPGWDIAGTVESVGKDVSGLHPGDEVFGESKSAFAEYVSVPENVLAPRPINLTLEQAASVSLAANTAWSVSEIKAR